MCPENPLQQLMLGWGAEDQPGLKLRRCLEHSPGENPRQREKTEGRGPEREIAEDFGWRVNSQKCTFCMCSDAQLHPTLCNPMDHSPPGSSVPGILQARIQWVAIPFSRGSSQPRNQTHVSLYLLHWQAGSLPLTLPEKAGHPLFRAELQRAWSLLLQQTVGHLSYQPRCPPGLT